MKKVLLVTGVALLALASISSAAGLTQVNLTVGSTGDAVSALQSWLMTNGYSIPAITAGTAPGYFGSQTKAALIAYQTKVGLPAQGFYGPLTYASMTSTSGTGSMASLNCPAGYTCTSNTPAPVVTCPVGYTCTSNTGTSNTGTSTVTGTVTTSSGTSITTPGVAGTLSVSNSSSVANGATVNDGQSVDVAGFKLQAGPSDQLVTSATVDFSVRPWLYFSTLSLVNQTTGQVILAPQAVNASMFTEITAGSDYRITLSGMNLIVPHGQQVNLVLHGQLLPSVGGTSRQGNINLTYASVRSVDGTGVVSDSLYSGTTQGIYYQGVLLGNLIVSIDTTSPLNQVIQTQTGASTQGVPLAVYNIQSQNSASTLQGLNVDVTTTGAVPSSVFNSIQLMAGGQTYYGAIASTSGDVSTYSFTNMNIPLALNSGVQFKIVGNVAPGITGDTATVTLNAPVSCTNNATACTSTNFNGTDSSYNTPTVQAAGAITSNITTFSTTGAISVAPGVVSIGPVTPTTQANVQGNTAASFNFTYTVSAGNTPIYVSASPATAVSLNTSLGDPAINAAASTSIATAISGGNQIAGDTNVGLGTTASGAFVVQANESRVFTVTAIINNAGNATTASNAIIQVSKVWYATSAANTTATSSESYYSSGLTSLQSPGVTLLTK